MSRLAFLISSNKFFGAWVFWRNLSGSPASGPGKILYAYITVMLVMTIITVRIDDETRRMMREVKVNWSDFIRNAIRRKVEEERRRNLARAVLINERLRRASRGEAKAEEIIRKFRDERYAEASC
jgi:hypothetical protein